MTAAQKLALILPPSNSNLCLAWGMVRALLLACLLSLLLIRSSLGQSPAATQPYEASTSTQSPAKTSGTQPVENQPLH
ncbi:MAG: hypothetical protein AAGG44_10820, partial [Planctomycetota bacterium]